MKHPSPNMRDASEHSDLGIMLMNLTKDAIMSSLHARSTSVDRLENRSRQQSELLFAIILLGGALLLDALALAILPTDWTSISLSPIFVT